MIAYFLLDFLSNRFRSKKLLQEFLQFFVQIWAKVVKTWRGRGNNMHGNVTF